MSRLFLLPSSVKRDPAIDSWLKAHSSDLGAIAHYWFDVMRHCGKDVRETMHDGAPTVCVEDAAFAYVNVFTAHANIGFFLGAELADPEGLLEGNGKFMRHVKLRPDRKVDDRVLRELIQQAYVDMKKLI